MILSVDCNLFHKPLTCIGVVIIVIRIDEYSICMLGMTLAICS